MIVNDYAKQMMMKKWQKIQVIMYKIAVILASNQPFLQD